MQEILWDKGSINHQKQRVLLKLSDVLYRQDTFPMCPGPVQCYYLFECQECDVNFYKKKNIFNKNWQYSLYTFCKWVV